MKLEQYFEGISDFDQVIRLKPDYAEAYESRGRAKGNLGYPENAISDFNEAIRLDPDYANAYCNRGTAKNLLGHNEEGKQDLQTALDLAEQQGDETLKTKIMSELQSTEKQ